MSNTREITALALSSNRVLAIAFLLLWYGKEYILFAVILIRKFPARGAQGSGGGGRGGPEEETIYLTSV